jgi:hypothetical protein
MLIDDPDHRVKFSRNSHLGRIQEDFNKTVKFRLNTSREYFCSHLYGTVLLDVSFQHVFPICHQRRYDPVSRTNIRIQSGDSGLSGHAYVCHGR